MFASVVFFVVRRRVGGRDDETRLLPTDSDTTKPLTEDTHKLQDVLLLGFSIQLTHILFTSVLFVDFYGRFPRHVRVFLTLNIHR